MKDTKWVVGEPNGAAARLGMNRSTVFFRMMKLGIVKLGILRTEAPVPLAAERLLYIEWLRSVYSYDSE